MDLQNFTFEIDADNIALVTWNMAGKTMNVIDAGVLEELEAIIARVESNADIKGVVVTSGKDTFSGGADLKMLEGLLKDFHAERAAKGQEEAAKMLLAQSRVLSGLFRRIEVGEKPWVAAINGTCLGGAFELALACHARIVSKNEKTRLGLPEAKVGLFPGAGGTQRVLRMTDPQSGLQMLTQGQMLKPAKAKGMKLIDAIVAPEDLIGEAKKAINDGLSPKKPWDQAGFRLPGGRIWSPQGMQFWPAANAIYRRETYDNYPGIRAILHCAYEGLQLPMDLGLQVESRYFAYVLQQPEAANMIRSLFVSMQDLGKGARRPKGVPASDIKKVGVLGAGFMGAGIAYVTARAGIDVVLIDRDQESADKGKAHVQALVEKQVSRSRMKKEDGEVLLARVHASADYGTLKGCELVVEAVFEDRDVKKAVTEQAEAALGKDAVFGSNTSTLPITSLAENSVRPKNFIGIHFFSPVDRMMLVEIIMGKKTGDKALAVALDYVKAIKKTPIVVNDSRGFFANRCVGNYLLEGHLMLAEGVPPAMVENVARMAGMPVGPLTLNDEVALDLAWKVVQATKKDLGDAAIDPRQEKLLETMVVKNDRLGRKNGKGFFDYDGKNKRLWPDLQETIGAPKRDADSIDVSELKQRFLVTQALEAARCVQEKVITDVREADVGSILGFGFAPYTGGTLSYIDMMGTPAFLALCKALQKKHGDRFKPNKLIRDMAKAGETFYGKFPPPGAARDAV